jgi:hypothetical protein
MGVEQDNFAASLKELSQYSFKVDSLIMDTALALSGLVPHGAGATVAPLVGSYKMGQPSSALVDNPYFTVNGVGRPSPKTKHLLRHRKVRNYVQSFTGTAASLGSMALPVNPYALIRDGSSAGASIVHLYRFAEMARNCRQSKTVETHEKPQVVQPWCRVRAGSHSWRGILGRQRPDQALSAG